MRLGTMSANLRPLLISVQLAPPSTLLIKPAAAPPWPIRFRGLPRPSTELALVLGKTPAYSTIGWVGSIARAPIGASMRLLHVAPASLLRNRHFEVPA